MICVHNGRITRRFYEVSYLSQNPDERRQLKLGRPVAGFRGGKEAAEEKDRTDRGPWGWYSRIHVVISSLEMINHSRRTSILGCIKINVQLLLGVVMVKK